MTNKISKNHLALYAKLLILTINRQNNMAFDDLFRLSVHAAIFNEQQQILQIKANYADKRWGLPGGCIDPGETIHETLLRECLEELSAEIKVCYLSGVYYHKTYNSQAFIFKCELPDNAIIQLSAEHTDYRNFDLDELSTIQQQRINDCLNFDGHVKSRKY